MDDDIKCVVQLTWNFKSSFVSEFNRNRSLGDSRMRDLVLQTGIMDVFWGSQILPENACQE